METGNNGNARCYSYIRFSRPEQLKGDSLRRQIEQSEAYAKKHNLIIDDSLRMEDHGLSAYNGVHKDRGALGEFLKVVEDGKVPKKSVLIVESLDRLSREEVLSALKQFISILEAGIKIVTLSDGMEYSSDSVKDFTQLLISITIMSRAHEESEIKSRRIKSAWENKRNNIKTKKLTRMAPLWLKLNDDKTEFIEIKDRCNLVVKIFEEYRDGKGMGQIAHMFNKSNIKPWGRGTGWHISYINKILHNRGVIGEFQPHKKKDGKRVPAGEPIVDYYPRIVSDELYYQVHDRIKNNGPWQGRRGRVANLFTHITTCGYCGYKMAFVNKGKRPVGNKYLVCDKARRRLGCKYNSIRYVEFESAFLNYCLEIDISSIIRKEGDARSRELEDISTSIDATNGQLSEIETQKNNYVTAIGKSDSNSVLELLTKNLEKASQDEQVLKDRLKDLQLKFDDLSIQVRSQDEHLNNIKILISQISTDGPDVPSIRQRLKTQIRKLVKSIVVFPIGLKDAEFYIEGGKVNIRKITGNLDAYEHLGCDPEIFGDETQYKEAVASEKKRVKALIAENTGREKRCFVVIFHTGAYKIIMPDDSTPSGYSVWAEKEGDILKHGPITYKNGKMIFDPKALGLKKTKLCDSGQ